MCLVYSLNYNFTILPITVTNQLTTTVYSLRHFPNLLPNIYYVTVKSRLIPWVGRWIADYRVTDPRAFTKPVLYSLYSIRLKAGVLATHTHTTYYDMGMNRVHNWNLATQYCIQTNVELTIIVLEFITSTGDKLALYILLSLNAYYRLYNLSI